MVTLKEVFMQSIPMTPRGKELLSEELNQLKSVDRPRIISSISEARSHGDLKENAEYHAAREQQGLVEARIRHLESRLSNCQVIDITQMVESERVIFGTTVTICNIDTDEEVVYTIVGEDESDLKLNRISITSPIARALIGHCIGEEVAVQAPTGEIIYEITNVQYI